MRARHFRPNFDRLDIRLVLSDSGATLVACAGIGAAAVSMVDDTDDSTQTDLVTIVDWYLPGSPPPDTYNPMAIQTPPDMTPATN